jgi:hypothetical protein
MFQVLKVSLVSNRHLLLIPFDKPTNHIRANVHDFLSKLDLLMFIWCGVLG